MRDEEIFGAPPRRTAEHEIGQNLDDLSIAQIEELIVLLRAEIERLEKALDGKKASLGAAAAVFRL